MTTRSEDVLLQMGCVRYKKGDGTLYVMNERIAWMAENRDKVAVSHRFQDIKSEPDIAWRSGIRTDFSFEFSSAKNLAGRKAKSSVTSRLTRWQQYDVPFCESQRLRSPDSGPGQSQGIVAATSAEFQAESR